MSHYIIEYNGQVWIVDVDEVDTLAFLARHGHQIIAGPGSLAQLLMSVEWNLELARRLDTPN